MKRRSFPIPAIGPLCLGFTGASGCTDPVVGDWEVVELDGEVMPYVYSYTYSYGDYYRSELIVYEGALTIFEDLMGQVSLSYTAEQNYKVPHLVPYVSTSDILYGSEEYSEAYRTRVWMRPARGAARYHMVFLEGDTLGCALTSGDTVLSCGDGSMDIVFNRAD